MRREVGQDIISSVFTSGGGFMTIYDLLEEKKNAQETVSSVALWCIYYVYLEVEVHEEMAGDWVLNSVEWRERRRTTDDLDWE